MKQTLRCYLPMLLLIVLGNAYTSFAQGCSATISASQATLCAGETLQLSANASFTVTSWNWYKEGTAAPVGTAQHLPVSAAGRYRLVATGAACVTVESNTVEIVAGTVPDAPGEITGPATPCLFSYAYYSVAPVAGALSYTWSVPYGWDIISGQGTTSISVRAGYTADMISVRAENACGQSELAHLPVQTAPLPVIQGARVVCAGSTATYTFSTADATAYNWIVPEGWEIQGGQGTRTITVAAGSASGNISVLSSNECGTREYRITVEVSSATTGNTISSFQTICHGNRPSTIEGSVSCGNGGYTYQWESRTADQPDFTPIAGTTGRDYSPGNLYTTTLFRRRVTSGATTHYSNVIQVTVQPSPLPPLVDPVTVSAGSAATLSIKAPEEGVTYYWYDGEGRPIGKDFSVFTTGPLQTDAVFYVEAYRHCMSERSRVEVTVLPDAVPVVENKIICAGSSASLIVQDADPAGSYSWYATAAGGTPLATGTPYITPVLTEPTTYYLQMGNTLPRTAVTVDVLAAVSGNYVTGAQTVCAGNVPMPLTGSVPTGGSGAYAFVWEMSPDGVHFEPAAGDNRATHYNPGALSRTTWFRRTAKSGPAGCESISDAVQVTVLPPVANNTIVAPTPACAGGIGPEVIMGSMPTGGGGMYFYQWQKQQPNGTFAAISDATGQDYYQPGGIRESSWYRRVVTSADCTESVSDPVEVKILPAVEQPAIMQQHNQLTASVSGVAYAWLFNGMPLANSDAQTITITTSGHYQVQVHNAEGCYAYSDSLQVTLMLADTAAQQDSNSLTLAPNPSGGRVKMWLAETWHQAQVQVFDAMGKPVYQAYYPILPAQQELDLTSVPAGTYVLRVLTATRQTVQRLVISR